MTQFDISYNLVYGGGTDIYYVEFEYVELYTDKPIKFWIKNIFLATCEQFVSFKMLPSIYLYVLLFFVTRITLGQSLCSCKYVSFTYFYECLEHVLISYSFIFR